MTDGEITDLITARSKFEEDMSLQFTPCGNQIAIHIERYLFTYIGSAVITVEELVSIFEVKVLFIQTLKKISNEIFIFRDLLDKLMMREVSLMQYLW